MAQAIWTGTLRLSLVTIPVRLYSATAGTKKLNLHQIHEPSGKRIRYQKIAPGIGPVEKEDIVKGYEYTRGKYVLLTDEEIDDLKLESKQTIELVRFVEPDEIDPRFWEKPYYMLPDGDTAQEAYVTLQMALKKTRRVGIGRFILRGQDVIAAVRPCGNGILLETLRHEHEVRKSDEFFKKIDDVKIDQEALELAIELIKRKQGKFDSKEFQDAHYEAMRELIEAKIEDREPVIVDETKPSAKIINLKDALRRSVKRPEDADNKKRAAAARRTDKKKSAPAKRKSAKTRKSA